MEMELQYRAPGTRLHHRLTFALQPFTTNTSCFVVGSSRSRQYSAAQNHGEGMCALAALMQACGHGRALQIQAALCPSLLLAECRLQPGDEDETTKYHLTDYEATVGSAFTEQGTPDRAADFHYVVCIIHSYPSFPTLLRRHRHARRNP